MARELEDGAVVATGVASSLPILAIAVARATHAPRLTYLASVGAIDPEIDRLQPGSEDLAYLDGRRGELTIPDLFDHARRGRIDVMFFGAAEIDGHGNTNLTAIGELESPRYKLPGVAGAGTLRRWVNKPMLLVTRQSRRNLVPAVQVVSTSDPSRTTPLLTNLGRFEIGTAGARLTARHPWSSEPEISAATGFEFRTAKPLPITPQPSAEHLLAIRSIDPDGLREQLVA
nr:3-oxoadipate CoA-transferase subunit B-like [Nerophis lumbriciformis]